MELRDNRILITGGAGFIGSHVTQKLLDKGAEVHIVDNLFTGRQSHIPESATFDAVDIRSDDLVVTVRESAPDALVHLAAIHHIPYCNAHPEETFNVNVMGTRNVLTAAETAGVKRVVFTSSGAVYPPDSEVHTETDPVGPDDIYGRTKLIGEELMELFQRRTNRSAITARVFNTYGPRETNEHVIPAILTQLEEGRREIELGNLSPKRDFVYVTDVADALVRLLEADTEGYGTYNVARGDAYSVRDVVETIDAAFDDRITIQQDDDRVRESDRPHLEADINRLQTDLDWRPTVDFESGLHELMEHKGLIEE